MIPWPIVLGCGSTKGACPMPAWRLYQGSYFVACRKWATSMVSVEALFILSARYGLIRATDVIEPYDVKMGQAGAITANVAKGQAATFGLSDKTVLTVGIGRAYAVVAKQAFGRCISLTEHMPITDTRMGYQIQWLRSHLGKLPDSLLSVEQAA